MARLLFSKLEPLVFFHPEAVTMTPQKKLGPAIMGQFTGSETSYRYVLAGDAPLTEGVKYVAETADA
jgi:hypothetical protein